MIYDVYLTIYHVCLIIFVVYLGISQYITIDKIKYNIRTRTPNLMYTAWLFIPLHHQC